MDEEPQVAPKLEDKYLNGEILLPKGDKMARFQVVHCKQDAKGNSISRSNQNHIMDTHFYEM